MDSRIFNIRVTDLANSILTMQTVGDISLIATELCALANDAKADLDAVMAERRRRRDILVRIGESLNDLCLDLLASENERGQA